MRRATSQLCAEAGLFKKRSHGGKSARASYTPQWSVFRSIVADWDGRMKSGAGPNSGGANRAKSPSDYEGGNRAELPGSREAENTAKSPGSETSSLRGEQGETVRQTGRNRPVEQGEMALQTHLNNPSYEPISTTDASECDAARDNQPQKSGQMLHGLSKGNAGFPKLEKQLPTERAATPSCSRSEAAKQAAQRRVNEAIGCAAPEWKSHLWTLTAPADWDAAIEAEMQRRGSGIITLQTAVRLARLNGGDAAHVH